MSEMVILHKPTLGDIENGDPNFDVKADDILRSEDNDPDACPDDTNVGGGIGKRGGYLYRMPSVMVFHTTPTLKPAQ